jgi:RNA polymerase sigma-70 factor (ECF subfamily)
VRKTALGRQRDWLRWLGRLVDADPEAAEAPPAAHDLDGARVRGALARLARRQREVLDLVFFHDLTVEEAAGVMGVSLGAARRHYARAKENLAERLR